MRKTFATILLILYTLHTLSWYAVLCMLELPYCDYDYLVYSMAYAPDYTTDD